MPTPAIGHFERVFALATDGRLVAVGGARPASATRVSLFDLRAYKPAVRLRSGAAINHVE